jgi:selenide,water dikinase
MRHRLILAGGGHAHALVLRMWAMRPHRRPPATQITLVSRRSTAAYSGLVPAFVAGLASEAEILIDLRRLCLLAGATFVEAEITGLSPTQRTVQLLDRPDLRFDRLSLDLGAVTTDQAGADLVVKPLEPFLAWCEARRPDSPLTLRGGGAAAVELALAFRARGASCRLLLRGRNLALGSAAANRAGELLLAAAGIPLERQASATAPADLACTGSRAPAWLADCGLPTDARSARVLTEPTLAVLGHPQIFACGDCALVAAAPRPPSGVWAVRAAPVLAENLRRSLAPGRHPLRCWRPPRWALQLLGDGGAVAAVPRAMALWGPFALGPSRWLWLCKDRIDRRFMARFGDPEPMRQDAMACRGCAAKLAARPLSAALERLGIPAEAEDAPLMGRASDGSLLLQSVDGFPALVDDPWLNGRLTTLHACGDLWASGASVDTAQALVTVPEASAPLQEDLLLQTLAGVRSVFEGLGARLIGGHTLEGRDGAGLGLALCVNGRVAPERRLGKGPLRPGDGLLLSRALGTGVLFAAAREGRARPDWIDQALQVMQQSQAPLVEILMRHGCRACTDVTGFGLLGHLGEMLQPGQRVELDLEAIPALPGALDLLAGGAASSLAPANAAALSLLEGPVGIMPGNGHGLGGDRGARRQLLIDPQTCGPLLAALPSRRIEPALAALHAAGFSGARLVGWVRPSSDQPGTG